MVMQWVFLKKKHIKIRLNLMGNVYYYRKKILWHIFFVCLAELDAANESNICILYLKGILNHWCICEAEKNRSRMNLTQLISNATKKCF